MSEPKFTPGPWEVSRIEPDALVAAPDGRTFTVGDTLYHPENLSNANLIAAAPDLYAACVAVVEQDGFVGSALMRKRIEQMKAAIAKANGITNTEG